MEGELCASRIISPSPVESSDEDLAVLPRHTKVIVTGNNRTKSVLVGLQGVVKKAVGFGGWHWLVLKNGVEVKLQRNALSVLEAPTGNEDHQDLHCDNSLCSSTITVDKHVNYSIKEFRRSTKPRARNARPWTSNQSSYRDIQLNVFNPRSSVNLSKLGTRALWRYWKHFNLVSINPKPYSKEQLIHGVENHFLSQQLDEKEVIVSFIHATKKRLKAR
ncbi:hypothetical protein J5N97_023546 [Dioscorea zingiberensis]|uniref:Histone deacetylase complex subunit SAP30 Sin3 binding domain-containing protein n=1 Tax=Dioscorea zingiberensis TaxID=325984 RepID=A0A9D5C5W8_9LILI|nr:hypothetical protein J5N97_023546 [Dioscorea zingiberensis]